MSIVHSAHLYVWVHYRRTRCCFVCVHITSASSPHQLLLLPWIGSASSNCSFTSGAKSDHRERTQTDTVKCYGELFSEAWSRFHYARIAFCSSRQLHKQYTADWAVVIRPTLRLCRVPAGCGHFRSLRPLYSVYEAAVK